MKIINGNEAKQIRQKFIDCFVNKNTEVFSKINKPFLCSDGYCYVNYLWDTLKNFRLCDERYVEDLLKTKKKFYIMWDIHSRDYIWIEDYWKYPKESVLEVLYEDFDSIKKSLPEDIYLFDDNFNWGYALTHEEIEENKRYCLEFF